jgi:hypothetical protein
MDMRILQVIDIKIRHGMREHPLSGPIHKTKDRLVECLLTTRSRVRRKTTCASKMETDEFM